MDLAEYVERSCRRDYNDFSIVQLKMGPILLLTLQLHELFPSRQRRGGCGHDLIIL